MMPNRVLNLGWVPLGGGTIVISKLDYQRDLTLHSLVTTNTLGPARALWSLGFEPPRYSLKRDA